MSVEALSRARLAPSDEAELSELLATRHVARQPLRISGGATRVQADHIAADQLSLSSVSGVVDYAPGELTLIVRTGTSLAEVQQMLAAEGQALAFEPPDLRGVLGGNGVPTIGGMVAANASGPRRLIAGACRDHLLGVRFVDGQGRVVKNGGRVMKNVTGLDLSKLMAGAHGTLGVLTEVALKVLPISQTRATLAFPETDMAQAVRIFSTALATPFEVSGAAWHDGAAYLRIEGLAPQLSYRQGRLTDLYRDHQIEVLATQHSDRLWQDLRDLAHMSDTSVPLWRVLVKPSDAPRIADALRKLGGQVSLDWGGGLIWYQGPGEPSAIRAIARHATLTRRAGLLGPAFPPLSGPVALLSQRLRRSFDPAGILNPGLMDA